jgi:hypothetical protein
MIIDEMPAAKAALETYASSQGDARVQETEDDLSVTFAITDLSAALTEGDALTGEREVTVTLRFTIDGAVLNLRRAHHSEGWESVQDGASPAQVLTALQSFEDKDFWPTDLLLRADAQLAQPQDATGQALLSKQAWRAALGLPDDAWAWVGPNLDAFTLWLKATPWQTSARLMFATPVALVLVADAPPFPAGAPTSLRIVKPGTAMAQAPAEPWSGILDKTDEPAWAWRAACLAPPASAPAELRNTLRGVATAAAAWSIAEYRSPGDPPWEVRPQLEDARTWRLDEHPQALEAEAGETIRSLARWVAGGGTELHLSVARVVAAKEIRCPFDNTPSTGPIAAARLAFSIAIDDTVREQLAQQERFERTFLEIDESVAEVRASISSAVDDVVTRALAAALTISIAALASPKVRGLPAAIAAVVILIYLFANVYRLHKPTRAEVTERLDGLDREVRGRRGKIDSSLTSVLEGSLVGWRAQIRKRLCAGIVVLLLLALGGIAGLVLSLAEGDSEDGPVTVTVVR